VRLALGLLGRTVSLFVEAALVALSVGPVMQERAVVLHSPEDCGSGERCVHPVTQNPPGNPNTPR
jgi:hypothetical protein